MTTPPMFRERMMWDEDRGEIRDGDIRYMLIRPDALMGLFKGLPDAERERALLALQSSIFEHGGRSAQTYQVMGADDAARLLAVIENTSEGYDLDELGSYLQQVKQRFPDKADATLLLEPEISYQTLVAVMDRVRVIEQLDESANQVTVYELFPEIAIGDAPVRN